MASSKLMTSSNSRNSGSPSSSPSPAPHFATTNFIPIPDSSSSAPKTVDQMWRHIVAGDRLHCKEETPDDAAPVDDDDDEMMTLEDFLLAKAGTGLDDDDDGGGDGDGDTNADLDDVKMLIPLGERLGSGAFALESVPTTAFQEGSVIGFGNGVEVVEGGRGKRARPVLEHLDKAAQQRQRRMIKNRESAARSRERKQAYQVELESLAVKLEEENDRLLKEKAERKKERYKQLMEKVLPIAQKQRPPCILRRARSLQW